MSDLLERLRHEAEVDDRSIMKIHPHAVALCTEAADEIESLTSQLSELKAENEALRHGFNQLQSAAIKEAAFVLRERFEVGETNEKSEDRLRLSAIRLSDAAKKPLPTPPSEGE